MTTLLSLKQAMARLAVSRKTVLLLIARGKVPALKVGRQWRFEPHDVETYITDQKAAAQARVHRPAGAPAPRRRKPVTQTRWKGADRYLN